MEAQMLLGFIKSWTWILLNLLFTRIRQRDGERVTADPNCV